MLFDTVDREFHETGHSPVRVALRHAKGSESRLRDLAPQSPAAPADLFAGLAVYRAGPSRWRGIALSAAGHGVAVILLALVPIVIATAPPPRLDYIRVLVYDPPPPPPPPLLRGTPLARPARAMEPAPVVPSPSTLVAPVEVPRPSEPVQAPSHDPVTEAAGSPEGGDTGSPDGMEGGVEGGMVGGVPGGVVGGVIGGTGTGPVPVSDYDSPPRLLRRTTPEYPSEAFVKKVEGTVELELLIDADGRLARIRVVHSVPLLDEAAIRAVRQWVFSPGIRHGRPVATLARAPIGFHIY